MSTQFIVQSFTGKRSLIMRISKGYFIRDFQDYSNSEIDMPWRTNYFISVYHERINNIYNIYVKIPKYQGSEIKSRAIIIIFSFYSS